VKIAFILDSKFPTQKAYGVTTRETVLDLIEKKFYVKIYSKASSYMDSDFTSLNQALVCFKDSVLVKLLSRSQLNKSTNLKYILWKIDLLLYLRKIKKNLNSFNPQVIWTRNPQIAFYCLKRFKSTKIILEIHGTEYSKYLKKLKKYNSRVLFCPINLRNLDFLNTLNSNFHFIHSPMAINSKILAKELAIKNFTQQIQSQKYKVIKVGYVGKFSPIGYSKGTEDLIQFANLVSGANKYKIELVGVEEKQIGIYTKLIKNIPNYQSVIGLVGHVIHSQAISIMRDMDILVLPSFRSTKYIGMPIKMLEYCAVGKIIVAADNPLFRSLFGDSFQPFWYNSGDPQSMLSAIELAISRPDLEKIIITGVEYASKFTWSKRNSNILNGLPLLVN
jgi:glycosyltransferase involved in cell wall biosynthesis